MGEQHSKNNVLPTHSMKHRLQEDGNQNILILQVCVNVHTHSHTPPLLYFTFENTVCHLAYLHTHRPMRVRTFKHSNSFHPTLFFVSVAVHYRSQLCNCVGVAYFLSHFLLFPLVSRSVKKFQLNPKKLRIDCRAAINNNNK